MRQYEGVKPLFSYRKYWAHRFGVAPFLPTTREEMDLLGWDSCDIIFVTGDSYIDHPSFGTAILGRVLEAQGFRVGVISQPNWRSLEDFEKLGQPNLYFAVNAGNMDSMVNHYTADRKVRRNDAYTAGDVNGKRPDRAVIVYTQKLREAFKETPIVIGGIEASLRRVAHYDYWSETIRRSVLIDSAADMLLFGNGERSITELSHRLANGETIDQITDIRGSSIIRPHGKHHFDRHELDSTHFDHVGKIDPYINPYGTATNSRDENAVICDTNVALEAPTEEQAKSTLKSENISRTDLTIRLPSFEDVNETATLYAHASRILHLETNPFNARPMVQQHGDLDVWINPPPFPLSTKEMDAVYALPFERAPHPSYGDAHIPAWEMIKHSVSIMRGCFGGCTFCSITEHEGRIIQSRSEESILAEVEEIRDRDPTFKGYISDLGGPTANMYRLACKDPNIEKHCRKLSCVYPGICQNLNTDHKPLINLYKKAREIEGIKRIHIASGVRYDLAAQDPEYIKELVTHHVGGYLKIAPEHTEEGPLSKMMKPSMKAYEEFKTLFEKYSKEAGKEQYLIPYFIAAHPGTTDEDMLNLALWLKKHDLRADQVQAFMPTPMSVATAMYYSERNPLKPIRKNSEQVGTAKSLKRRQLHKAFLRYHDPNNWPLLRQELRYMGRADLIGPGKECLIPGESRRERDNRGRTQNSPKGHRFTTNHQGIPRTRKSSASSNTNNSKPSQRNNRSK